MTVQQTLPNAQPEVSAAAAHNPNIGNPDPLPLGLWAMIREDWVAHGRDWTLPGFRAVAVHRFGVWRMQVKPKVLRAPLSKLYKSLYRKVRNTYGIELPYTVRLGRRVVIEHQGNIVIHGYCEIGDDSIIRQGVTLGLRHVERPFDAPKLGNHVNIGAGAKLFGHIRVGDNVNIGANAVVLTDVPDKATAVGIPARIISAKSD
ncbi:MAG: serine O-acetyltransferase [Elainellaceae cyanobacterium]